MMTETDFINMNLKHDPKTGTDFRLPTEQVLKSKVEYLKDSLARIMFEIYCLTKAFNSSCKSLREDLIVNLLENLKDNQLQSRLHKRAL